MQQRLRAMIEKLSPQANLRPTGVWDFVERPDGDAAGRDEAAEFERLWAMAEREAYAAGDVAGATVAAQ